MGACCSSRADASSHVGVLSEKPGTYQKAAPASQQQKQTWAVTGIVSLRDSNLKVRRLGGDDDRKCKPSALSARARVPRLRGARRHGNRRAGDIAALLGSLESTERASAHGYARADGRSAQPDVKGAVGSTAAR